MEKLKSFIKLPKFGRSNQDEKQIGEYSVTIVQSLNDDHLENHTDHEETYINTRRNEREQMQVCAYAMNEDELDTLGDDIHLVPVEVDDKMIYVEEEVLDDIQNDLVMLKEIANDMSTQLDIDNENLEQIEKHVDESMHNVKAAGAEVEKALILMKKGKYKRSAITVGVCAGAGGLIGLIGGPVGAAIGTGLGAGVGIIGSAISSLIDV